MRRNTPSFKKLPAFLLAVILLLSCFAAYPENTVLAAENPDSSGPEKQWQGRVTFPDWKGYTDDTLAMNCMYSFFGYHGQGTVTVEPQAGTEGFRMYVNGYPVDTAAMKAGGTYTVDAPIGQPPVFVRKNADPALLEILENINFGG